MDTLASIVKELFSDPTPRKWRTAVFLGVLIMAGAFIAEVSTGFRFLWVMDRKVELLTELNELAVAGADKNPQLAPIYNDLSSKLNGYKVEPLTIALVTTDDAVATTIKVLAAAWLWILVLLVLVFRLYKGNGSRSIFAGALLMVVLSGGLAYWLPSVGSFWVNAAIYIIVNIGIIRFINTYGDNTRKTKPQPTSQSPARPSRK